MSYDYTRDPLEGRRVWRLKKSWVCLERRVGFTPYLRLIVGHLRPDGRQEPPFYVAAFSLERARGLLEGLRDLLESPPRKPEPINTPAEGGR